MLIPIVTVTCSWCWATSCGATSAAMIFCALRGRIVRVLDLRQQHDEFIAALTADRVRAPDARHQASCHRLQQRVANRMSQAVVHVLEPIQIEEQHGQAVAVTAGQGNRLVSRSFSSMRLGRSVRKSCCARWTGLQRRAPRRAHIVEHDHGADDLPAAIVDRGGGIFDGRSRPRRAG